MDTKKIFLSTIVITTFLGYSFYARVKGINQMPALAPVTNSNRQAMINSVPITPTVTSFPTTAPTTSVSSNTGTPTATSQPDTPTPTSTSTPTPTPKPSSQYKDGTYTGSVEDAFYGSIQVQATISGGKITNIQFLQAPNDNGTSIYINSQADPMLAQEAIQAQNANVNIISGASDSSQAFMQSLQSALDQAKS